MHKVANFVNNYYYYSAFITNKRTMTCLEENGYEWLEIEQWEERVKLK